MLSALEVVSCLTDIGLGQENSHQPTYVQQGFQSHSLKKLLGFIFCLEDISIHQ